MEILAGWILGIVSALIVEPIRQHLFAPNPCLIFNKTGECNTTTMENLYTPIPGRPDLPAFYAQHEAHYIRIKVENRRRALAKSCRAYLVNIERANEIGNFVPTKYVDSIALPWSCREQGTEYSPTDIPNGVSQFIDVISTREIAPNVYRPHIQVYPERYKELFLETGRFRFTIQVAGENFDPKIIKIIFIWQGGWDSYEIE